MYRRNMVWNFKNRNINMCFLSSKKIHVGITVFDHLYICWYATSTSCYYTERETMIRKNTGVFGPRLRCKSRNWFFGNWRRLIFLSTAGLVERRISLRKLQLLYTQPGLLLSQENNIRGGIRGINAKKLKLFIPCGGCFRKKKIQTLSFSIHCLI